MSEISLIEKLKVIFEITKSNIVYPFIILFLFIVSFLFITTNKNNAKESKKTYGIIYLIMLITILIKYSSSLQTMFDYMMNNLFIVFYFPNIAVYLSAIIITNIIMWTSIFKTTTKTFIKIVNSIIFSAIHYLFILTLSIITTKNINVFDQKALYANKDIHSLIELSSNIFLIWLVFLIVYKLILTYLESKKATKISTEIEINNPNEIVPIAERNLQINLPNNVTKVTPPYIVKREELKPQITPSSLNNIENIAFYDQVLTIDDYKLLVSLLKDQKERDIKKLLDTLNNGTITDKEKTTTYQVKTEKETKPKENSLSELMKLYAN